MLNVCFYSEHIKFPDASTRMSSLIYKSKNPYYLMDIANAADGDSNCICSVL